MTFCFLISIAAALTLGTGCSSIAKENHSRFSNIHKERFEYVIELRNLSADDVWPGFRTYLPSVVYFTDQSQLLINPKSSPPAEYKQLDLKGPSWGADIYLASQWTGPVGHPMTKQEVQAEFIGNAFDPEDTEGHFLFPVFFLDSLEQFETKNNKWKLDDWYAMFWHEIFHNFQSTLFDKSLTPNSVRSMELLQPYIRSEEFLKKIRKEQLALSRALKEKDFTRKRKIICSDFISLRKTRYATMAPAAVRSEQYNEISEGTARYVEEFLSMRVGQKLLDQNQKEKFAHQSFNFFRKYSSNSRETFFDTIQKVSPQNIYFYNSGFGLALVLDQVAPDWKQTAFKTDQFLSGTLNAWCGTNEKKI